MIGLTDWGVSPEGSSLNFFIPIDDALDFLGLKPAGCIPRLNPWHDRASASGRTP